MANFEIVENGSNWNEMTTPKVMERMQELYESNKWHDRVFKLWKSDGSGEELVFAHNIILASSSPVFEALCFGPMAEKNTIEIPDIDPASFRTMLKFIYTDCIEFGSVELACNVLYASKKYLIYTLANLAISYISHHINESNCLQIYEFATFIQEDRLIKESWSYICSHLDDAFVHFTHESLSTDLVKNLLKEEALNGGEIVLFKICLMWAEAECEKNNLEKNSENLRKVLIISDIFNKIRWLTLSMGEFEAEPLKSGILTREEIHHISRAILFLEQNETRDSREKTRDCHCKMPKLSWKHCDANLDNGLFPVSINNTVEARKRIQLKKFYCHRFIEKEIRPNSPLKNNLKIKTCVTANKSVRLTAVFINAKILPLPRLHNGYVACCDIASEYNEKVVMSICDSFNKVLCRTVFFEKVGYGTVFKIALPNAAVLERSKEYSIQIELVNFSENYLFGVRNTISKFPSGLCVTFKEFANLGNNEEFVEANDLSIISGLELCL